MKSPAHLVIGLALTVCFLTASAKDKKEAAVDLQIHPKVFSMVNCWLSDSESPVVTEINLDAVAANGNQFPAAGLVQEDGWTRCPGDDGRGFMRYRVAEARGTHYKIEFQENGGGSLTTSIAIEFSIEKRDIRLNGKSATIRVLRVLGLSPK